LSFTNADHYVCFKTCDRVAARLDVTGKHEVHEHGLPGEATGQRHFEPIVSP
jgi:hypothetical protein